MFMQSLESRVFFSGNSSGDFNHDGTVSTLDYNIFAAAYLKTAAADANGDGRTDSIDFNVLVSTFGQTVPIFDPPPVAGNWSLQWHDEFDATTTPYQRGWAARMWNDVGIGSEIDDVNNAVQANGVLSLNATRMPDGSIHSGMVQAEGTLGVGGKIPPLESYLYGYMEVRVDVPDANGTWPQIWQMATPVNGRYIDTEGEIDLYDNGDSNPNHVCGGVGVHGASFRHDRFADASGGYHIIAIDWQPDHVNYYFDGKIVSNMQDTTIIPHVAMSPILNLAINPGDWGTPPAASFQSATMNIDFIRIWQRS